jgi:hypothetical protein
LISAQPVSITVPPFALPPKARAIAPASRLGGTPAVCAAAGSFAALVPAQPDITKKTTAPRTAMAALEKRFGFIFSSHK